MVTPLFQKIIISLITLLLLAYVGYSLYNVTPDPTMLANSVEVDSASQEILTLVDKLESVTFDQAIFTSPLFVSLVDYSLDINQEQVGRPNPFAPIGIDSYNPTVASSVKKK